MSSPEQAPQGPENSVEMPKVSPEQYEALEKGAEIGIENSVESGEKAAERAKVEAMENAISIEAGSAEKAKKQPKNATPTKRRGTISKKEQAASFKKHMAHVQSEMSVPSRLFSKVIHNKAIEKSSDVVGATVARPNAVLFGALAAFILTLVVYLLAKNYGYVLSGFETIAAFIVGWIIGVLYDYFRVMITGKK